MSHAAPTRIMLEAVTDLKASL